MLYNTSMGIIEFLKKEDDFENIYSHNAVQKEFRNATSETLKVKPPYSR